MVPNKPTENPSLKSLQIIKKKSVSSPRRISVKSPPSKDNVLDTAIVETSPIKKEEILDNTAIGVKESPNIAEELKESFQEPF